MNTTQYQIHKYENLNTLAPKNGTVLFGGTQDAFIPVSELKQSFEINIDCFNRSIDGLSLVNAKELYSQCVKPLQPECILLHIGENDSDLFYENKSEFIRLYRDLTDEIKKDNKKCRLVVLSIENPDNDVLLTEMNKTLKNFANSERLEYIDLSLRKNWNPYATKEVVSFVYSMGFVRPLKHKKPIFDLVRILYGYQNAGTTVTV